MSVEVFSGPVVAHGRARVGVPGGDLHIAEVDASIEHCCDEGVPQYVWMHPGQPDVRGESEPAQPLPIHPLPAPIQQYRSLIAAGDGSFLT